MRSGPGRRRSGIHGGETVVERQGTTKHENSLAPPRRRWSVYSITTDGKRLLILFACKMSMARWEILN
jgi:hypothetical protein